MTNDERFEKHIEDASAADLRKMVRAARLAMREKHSEIMHAEGRSDAAYELLEVAYATIATMRLRVDLIKAASGARPVINNGSSREFDRLAFPSPPSPTPF